MNTRRAVVALRHIARAPEVLRCIQAFDTWSTLVPAYIGFRPMPPRIDARTRSGVAFQLTEFYDVETLWQIYCRQVYAVDPQDRIIIDAGANIGLFTCFALGRAPRASVHAIEPFPDTFERLVSTVRANRLESRVTCHHLALSSSGGVSTMSASASASQMFHLERDGNSGAGVAVTTVTLSSLLDSIDAASIDLLKMDIEGSEYDVLLSTPADVLKRIRRVNLEFHKAPRPDANPTMLVRHLCGAGFRVNNQADTAADYGMVHFTR
jgi:FkbM family methyltransferase